MKLTHENLSVWINTYNRSKELNENIRSIREELDDRYQINIINNHSVFCLEEDYGNVKVHHNMMRPDESWGYLARSWNQCYYLGLDKTEYILVSQDDMIFRPGWLDLINNTRPYSFYSAPVGDVAHMTSRDAFLRVGWWDERFIAMDYHDYDYFGRVYQRMHDDSSVVDRGLAVSWNDIGLAQFWLGKGFKGDGTDRPRGGDTYQNRVNRLWYGQKRALGPEIMSNPMCHKDPRWRDINNPIVVPEIDWYPWFTAKMQRLTGKRQQFNQVPYTEEYGNDGYG